MNKSWDCHIKAVICSLFFLIFFFFESSQTISKLKHYRTELTPGLRQGKGKEKIEGTRFFLQWLAITTDKYLEY